MKMIDVKEKLDTCIINIETRLLEYLTVYKLYKLYNKHLVKEKLKRISFLTFLRGGVYKFTREVFLQNRKDMKIAQELNNSFKRNSKYLQDEINKRAEEDEKWKKEYEEERFKRYKELYEEEKK